jgi:Asp-tRNA(Asn)/Glu-tRNA(Gln) amidotransferase A subunit family amidase
MHTQSFELMEATIPQLQSALTAGIVTSRDLVTLYLARIDGYDQHGAALNAISVTNDKALAQADARDAERRAGAYRGPLHGIPVIVKCSVPIPACRPSSSQEASPLTDCRSDSSCSGERGASRS